MRAIKCDKCGKFYDYYIGIDETTKANKIILTDMDIELKHWSSRKTYNLCPDCMKEIKKFLENK